MEERKSASEAASSHQEGFADGRKFSNDTSETTKSGKTEVIWTPKAIKKFAEQWIEPEDLKKIENELENKIPKIADSIIFEYIIFHAKKTELSVNRAYIFKCRLFQVYPFHLFDWDLLECGGFAKIRGFRKMFKGLAFELTLEKFTAMIFEIEEKMEWYKKIISSFLPKPKFDKLMTDLEDCGIKTKNNMDIKNEKNFNFLMQKFGKRRNKRECNFDDDSFDMKIQRVHRNTDLSTIIPNLENKRVIKLGSIKGGCPSCYYKKNKKNY